MKTIDEAMALVSVSTDGMSESAAEAKMDAMAEEMEKSNCIGAEITRNANVIQYLNQYIAAIGPTLNFNVHQLALNIFINGVIIGMEMEKQEL